MRGLDSNDKDLVERIIDRYSVQEVLEAISEICHDKGVHIAEAWQDMSLAKLWHKRANDMMKVIHDYHFGDE